MNELSHIPSQFSKEFSVGKDGKVTASRRAIARLAGVDEKAVRLLLTKVQGKDAAELDGVKSLETLKSQRLGGAELSEIAAVSVIEYYAFDAGRYCKDQAKLVYRTFSAIGFRTWVQQELGWKSGKGQSRGTPPRLIGKGTRRKLTDAVQDYIDRHQDDLSANAVKWMYSNITDGLYLKTHELRASQLVRIHDCKKADLRDHFSTDEIEMITAVEFTAVQAIDKLDMHPLEAIKNAVEQTYATHLFSSVYAEEALKLKAAK